MTKKERNRVRELVNKHNGNTHKAIAEHLGAEKEWKAAGNEIPVGWEAAFHGIADEIDKHAELDAADDDSDGSDGDGKTTANAGGGANNQ